MIDLYASGSPNVLKVLFMLSEVELPYTLHHVRVMAGEQYSPAFLALNPNAKVPVIVDHEGPGGQPFTLFESGAILLYLAEKTGRLLPHEPAARYVALQWLMFQMAGIGPMFGQALHFSYVAPPGNDYGRARYVTEARRLYGVLDHRLGEAAYLAGEDFSIADIAAYPWAAKYPKTLGIDMAAYPHVAGWIERIEARPGYQRIHEAGKALFKHSMAEHKAAEPDGLDRFFGRGKYARV